VVREGLESETLPFFPTLTLYPSEKAALSLLFFSVKDNDQIYLIVPLVSLEGFLRGWITAEKLINFN
jgi:hypothetical protein